MARAKRERWIHKKLKLRPHKHTGKVLARHHTSYGALLVLSLFAGLMLTITAGAFKANADAITGEGILNLKGFMAPPKPNAAATIEQPINGQAFSSTPVDIHGSCATYPSPVMVVVIDNGLNMGQTICTEGRYDLKIDLLISNKYGINYLRVRQYELVDSYQAAGDESDVIKVYYYPRGVPPTASQLIISAEGQSKTALAGQPFKLKLTINGGTPPYAVDIKWGDSNEDVVSEKNAGTYEQTHVYQTGSLNYPIYINVSDSGGQKAYLQTITFIGGQKRASAGPGTNSNTGIPYVGSGITTIAPVAAVAIGGVAIFWLGEKFALHQIIHSRLWKTPRR